MPPFINILNHYCQYHYHDYAVNIRDATRAITTLITYRLFILIFIIQVPPMIREDMPGIMNID